MRRHRRGVTYYWLGLVPLLCASIAYPQTVETLIPESMSGFTADTQIDLQLEDYTIERSDWWAMHNQSFIMPATVLLSDGHGTDGSNKVMIYGDRTDSLIGKETDWSMTPRPMNIYFTSSQVAKDVSLPFGPALQEPENRLDWVQLYRYSACCITETGQSRSDSALLAVRDGK